MSRFERLIPHTSKLLDSGRVAGFEASCTECEETAEFMVSTRSLPEEVVENKFRQRGWFIRRNQSICPKCSQKSKSPVIRDSVFKVTPQPAPPPPPSSIEFNTTLPSQRLTLPTKAPEPPPLPTSRRYEPVHSPFAALAKTEAGQQLLNPDNLRQAIDGVQMGHVLSCVQLPAKDDERTRFKVLFDKTSVSSAMLSRMWRSLEEKFDRKVAGYFLEPHLQHGFDASTGGVTVKLQLELKLVIWTNQAPDRAAKPAPPALAPPPPPAPKSALSSKPALSGPLPPPAPVAIQSPAADYYTGTALEFLVEQFYERASFTAQEAIAACLAQGWTEKSATSRLTTGKAQGLFENPERGIWRVAKAKAPPPKSMGPEPEPEPVVIVQAPPPPSPPSLLSPEEQKTANRRAAQMNSKHKQWDDGPSAHDVVVEHFRDRESFTKAEASELLVSKGWSVNSAGPTLVKGRDRHGLFVLLRKGRHADPGAWRVSDKARKAAPLEPKPKPKPKPKPVVIVQAPPPPPPEPKNARSIAQLTGKPKPGPGDKTSLQHAADHFRDYAYFTVNDVKPVLEAGGWKPSSASAILAQGRDKGLFEQPFAGAWRVVGTKAPKVKLKVQGAPLRVVKPASPYSAISMRMRGNSEEIYAARRNAVETRACPKCGQAKGEGCLTSGGTVLHPTVHVHVARFKGL